MSLVPLAALENSPAACWCSSLACDELAFQVSAEALRAWACA